jgi:hypothetical protein
VGSANKKKKTQLKSTRQSSRLRKQGGVLVEELATRRKKKLNIEEPCTSSHNSFTVLDSIEDEVLIQTSHELKICLGVMGRGVRNMSLP